MSYGCVVYRLCGYLCPISSFLKFWAEIVAVRASQNFVRDIVDTLFHASRAFGRSGALRVPLPTVRREIAKVTTCAWLQKLWGLMWAFLGLV
jgi:hypothetical protein